MKSAEIREKTGLSEKALRLYEDKGLVTPEMREQGSRRIREYSEEDLAVKLAVRDTVLKTTQEILKDVTTRDEAEKILGENRKYCKISRKA